MSLEQIIPILQLAIGPVIVISGVGLVLLSMTNRFGRVIDRSRSLTKIIRSEISREAAINLLLLPSSRSSRTSHSRLLKGLVCAIILFFLSL